MKQQEEDAVREEKTGAEKAGVAAVLGLVSALCFVAVVSQLPVEIRASAAHDDAWFWLRARAIAGGGWLGGYDLYTLMKGSGYPLFLALAHGLGIPMAIAQGLLYAAACLLLGHALYRATGQPWLALLVVLVLQWHPASMGWSVVLRDNISAAQALLVLACTLQAAWVPRRLRSRLCWGAAAGVALGWFWTTREDGIWLLPGVALLLLAATVWAWRDAPRRRAVIAAGAALVLACLAWLGLVATANGVKYGEFVLTDVKGGAFADAVAALHSVRAGPIVPFVPVPRQVREAVYGVSPSFARLHPALEDPENFWSSPGCSVYPHTCGDFAGGWFLWALRDAAYSVGAYESAESAARFYRGLAEEVREACGQGRLQCRRSPIGLMPAVTEAQWRTLPSRLAAAAGLLGWQDVPLPNPQADFGYPRSVDMWRFVGSPKMAAKPGESGVRAAGWLRDADGAWLQARCGDRIFAIEPRPSPDLVAHFGDPALSARRFTLQLPNEGHCRLERVPGGERVALASVLQVPARLDLGGGELYLDEAFAMAPALTPDWALKVRDAAWRGYALLLPWLLGAGLLAFCWALGRAVVARCAGPWLVLAAAAWGVVFGRTLVLVLVDLAAFPAITVAYMQPAFAPSALAAIASLAAALGPSRQD